jgi:hypothetical protein
MVQISRARAEHGTGTLRSTSARSCRCQATPTDAKLCLLQAPDSIFHWSGFNTKLDMSFLGAQGSLRRPQLAISLFSVEAPNMWSACPSAISWFPTQQAQMPPKPTR